MVGLVRFLESETGLQSVAIVVFFAMVILTLLFRRVLLWQSAAEPLVVAPAPATSPVAAAEVAAIDATPRPRTASPDLADAVGLIRPQAALGGLLIAGAFVVPLVFTIASPDVFVITKLTALRLMLFVGLFFFGLIVAGTNPILGVLPVSRVVDLALIAYLLLTMLATAFSIEPATSLYGQFDQYQGLLTALLLAVFFVFARTTLAGIRRLRLLSIAALGGATLVAIYAIAQQLRLDPIWNTLDKGRVFSTLGQAEWLGAYFMLAFALGLPLVLCGRTQARVLAGAALALVLVGLLLTFSRGAYVGLVAGLVVFAIAAAPLIRLTRRWLAAVPAVLAILLLVVMVPPLRDEASAVLSRATSTANFSDGSINDRFDLWRVGAAIAADHPLLGTGPDTYPVVFPHYRDSVLGSTRAKYWLGYRPESPHNVLVAIADGAGLPALAAYLVLVAGVLVAIGRVLRRQLDMTARLVVAGIAAAIVGYFVTDLFMTADVAGTWILWLLLGAGIGLAERFAREDDESHGHDVRPDHAG